MPVKMSKEVDKMASWFSCRVSQLPTYFVLPSRALRGLDQVNEKFRKSWPPRRGNIYLRVID